MFDLNSLDDYDEINALMGDPLTLPQRGQTGGNIAYSLVKTNTKTNTHFQMRQTSYHYTINNNAEQRSMLEAEENFKSFITDFCATNIEPLHTNCKIKMMIVISSFDSPLNTFFVQKSQFTPDIIYTLFYNAVQSRNDENKELFKSRISPCSIRRLRCKRSRLAVARSEPRPRLLRYPSRCFGPCRSRSRCRCRSTRLLGSLFHRTP
jgi:hypothetical protein